MPSGDLETLVAAVLQERHCPGAVLTVSTDGRDPTFESRHPFEPEPSRWDFDGTVDDGMPTRLFTQRLHVRATA